MNVQFVVAPYEADAQLAYLYQKKKIDFVITEDSDLLAFGVQKVLFKMDLTGSGIEVDMSHLEQCDSFRISPSRKCSQATVFSQEMFLKTCILNGCDYIESVKGVGFKKALKLMKENDGDITIIVHVLDQDKSLEIDPHQYLIDFERAYLTFKH